MFDLFRSRDKVIRIFLGVLLGLVGLSMLTYLIPSYDTSSAGNDQVVAKVGKEEIMLPDVQKVVQNSVRNRQIPSAILPNYIPQMVQDMITDRALAYEAEQLGLQVTDADVRNTIRQMIPNLFPNGNFVGTDAYASMLAQQNLSIAEFESDLRRQILITRLRDIAVEGTVVSQAEIQEAYNKKYEKLQVEWVQMKTADFNKEVQPKPEEIKTYYDANKPAYQTPEKKNLVVLIADQAKLEQAYTPTDAQLLAAYNQNKEQYRVPERVKVRHILLKTTDKPASEEAKVKAKAEDLLKQIKAGGDFAELAKKNSEDTGSAQNGGALADWVTRGQTVPEFEQQAFTLKPGETSGLVKTQYGYHIIQVLQHENAHLRTFDEVKPELLAQMRQQQVASKMQDIADKSQTALEKDPAHPDKVAADFNMEVLHADGVQAGQPIGNLGTVQDLDQAIAPLKKGEVSQAVALPNNRVAIAVVTDVIAPHTAPFEDVENQIKDQMVRTRAGLAAQNHAQELLTKAKSTNGDLDKAAKSMGLMAKTSGDVERNGTVEGLGSATYLLEAFGKTDGSLFGPVTMPDGVLVGKVVRHIEPDQAKLATERATIRDQIKSDKARDRSQLFEAGLRDTLTKQGKIKIYQKVINNLIAQYRTS